MGVPNGNGNAPIDAWLSRWAETKAGHAAAGWGAAARGVALRGPRGAGGCARCRERAVEFWGKALAKRRTRSRIGGLRRRPARSWRRRCGGWDASRRHATAVTGASPADRLSRSGRVLEFEVELMTSGGHRAPCGLRGALAGDVGLEWGAERRASAVRRQDSGAASLERPNRPRNASAQTHCSLRLDSVGGRRALDAGRVPLRHSSDGCGASRRELLMRAVRPASHSRSCAGAGGGLGALRDRRPSLGNRR